MISTSSQFLSLFFRQNSSLFCWSCSLFLKKIWGSFHLKPLSTKNLDIVVLSTSTPCLFLSFKAILLHVLNGESFRSFKIKSWWISSSFVVLPDPSSLIILPCYLTFAFNFLTVLKFIFTCASSAICWTE